MILRDALARAGTVLALALAAAAAQAGDLSPLARLGQQMFSDKTLSASGRLACASCHDPAHAYAAPNGLPVQAGGARMTRAGVRAVPSLRYKEATPPYADMLDNPDGISTPGPGGGLTQDGRAATLAEQARIPLLNPIEMANRRPADVVARLRKTAYAGAFKAVFGEHAFDDKAAFDNATRALQAFQLEDPSFHPYSSRYDLYAGNKVGGTMSPAEARGFAVYNDPDKGNCFACHYNGAGLNGSVALFTDFTYAAIGVPRNSAIPANRDPRYADLGLCSRPDHLGKANERYCGEFKTPTLRNVATRGVFFHNGRMKSLAEAIRFYNTRDTEPERWYPTVDGVVRKYDDLPRRLHGNIDTQKPLDGRARGSQPPMTEQEMADLEAFLEMLTDKDVVALIPRHDPAAPALPDRAAAGAIVRRYLAEHGDFCLGKSDWPVDISAIDERARGRDVVQMPVLEALGLVRASRATVMRVEGPGLDEDAPAAAVPVDVTRYELTPAGERFMRDRSELVARADGDRVVRVRDLCAAHLALADVVAVAPGDGASGFVATYTYLAQPAPWAVDPGFQRAFPMAARVLGGERRMQLKQAFAWVDGQWRPAGLAN